MWQVVHSLGCTDLQALAQTCRATRRLVQPPASWAAAAAKVPFQPGVSGTDCYAQLQRLAASQAGLRASWLRALHQLQHSWPADSPTAGQLATGWVPNSTGSLVASVQDHVVTVHRLLTGTQLQHVGSVSLPALPALTKGSSVTACWSADSAKLALVLRLASAGDQAQQTVVYLVRACCQLVYSKDTDKAMMAR